MRVVWSPLALGQVQEIVEYIAQDKPMAASHWADRIFDLVETLKDAPLKGRIVPEVRRDEIRELLDGRYRVIYRYYQNRIDVLTVRHGTRRLDATDFDT